MINDRQEMRSRCLENTEEGHPTQVRGIREDFLDEGSLGRVQRNLSGGENGEKKRSKNEQQEERQRNVQRHSFLSEL